MVKIAIIILHFGNPHITFACLEALNKIKKENISVKVFVLDNQGSINRHSNYKNTTFLPFKKNHGFAMGNNYVVDKIKNENFDYYLFLNNDTVVYPNFLISLIKLLQKYTNVGICGPVIEHQVAGKTYYDYGGVINWQKTQAKHINKNILKTKEKLIYRDFVSGCCMLVRAHLFRQLNGFNDKYFMYLEDVDLCVRAKKLGYKIAVVPNAVIYHLGSKSATENFKIKQSLVNSMRFVAAHTPAKSKPFSYLFNLFFYPLLWLKWKLKFAFSFLKTR